MAYPEQQATRPAPGVRSARTNGGGPWARYANALVGTWLFISAFIWPHVDASRTNSWIVGALMVLFALWGVRASGMRWANTALSVWLFFSTIGIFHLLGATLWNNVIVAIVAFLISFVPNEGFPSAGRPARQL